MSKFGYLDRFVKIIRQFHDGIMAHVRNASDLFHVSTEVKQGCVLAPALFSVMFSAMLTDAFRETSLSVPIKTGVTESCSSCDVYSPSLKSKRLWSMICFLLMTVSSMPSMNKKRNRRWMHSHLPTTTSTSPSAPRRLKWYISPPQENHTRNQHHSEGTVTPRHGELHLPRQHSSLSLSLAPPTSMQKSATAFRRLAAPLGDWRSQSGNKRNIRVHQEQSVQSLILTTLLYGCETWTLYRRHEKLLQQFHLWRLRNIFIIRWQDKIPDTEILEKVDLPSIITIMHKAQTRWAGHVSYLSDCMIPKQLLYGELSRCNRKVGGQRKRYKDSLKAYPKDFNI